MATNMIQTVENRFTTDIDSKFEKIRENFQSVISEEAKQTISTLLVRLLHLSAKKLLNNYHNSWYQRW